MTNCFRRWVCRGAAVAVLALPACGGGGDVEASCGEVERVVDSRASGHVLDVDAAKYDHHPPASGPHFGGKPPKPGVYDEPIPEAKQVLSLEVGVVVVQYDEALAGEAGGLEALARARDDVIVAPAATPIDGGSLVAFTAWQVRRRCDGLSDDVVADAKAWIEEYAGVTPEEFRE